VCLYWRDGVCGRVCMCLWTCTCVRVCVCVNPYFIVYPFFFLHTPSSHSRLYTPPFLPLLSYLPIFHIFLSSTTLTSHSPLLPPYYLPPFLAPFIPSSHHLSSLLPPSPFSLLLPQSLPPYLPPIPSSHSPLTITPPFFLLFRY
jgi:hypothetical protein